MVTRRKAARRPRQSAEQTRSDYNALRGTADRLLACIQTQLVTLLERNDITLGVPMEARVKSLASVEEKLTNRMSPIESVGELSDLVGVRLILLFRRDLARMNELIGNTFRVFSFENTGDRLDETQFGYQSNHYVIRLPEAWLEIPSYADLGTLTAEIQVRTLAQHIWAAASHKLQYKREQSVPPPLRRTIHRVSALLETVDLEFERVLDQRASYVESTSESEGSQSPLNVDLVAKVLREIWPSENADEAENYDDLLGNLLALKVDTVDKLFSVLQRHRQSSLRYDKERVRQIEAGDADNDDLVRYQRGVYFTHVGLTRQALSEEFGRKKLWEVMGLYPLELESNS